MNIKHFNDSAECCKKGVELDHIDHLILCNIAPAEIQRRFPHYNNADIETMTENIARFYWYDADQWREITQTKQNEPNAGDGDV